MTRAYPSSVAIATADLYEALWGPSPAWGQRRLVLIGRFYTALKRLTPQEIATYYAEIERRQHEWES
jgi:hypothetical protein